MVNGWAEADKLLEECAKAGNVFVRLVSDGDKVVGAFRGKPHARKIHWLGPQSEVCDGADCKHCASGVRASPRFAFNFFVLADSEMRVFEGGRQWYEDVRKVNTKYGFDEWAFEVERRGDKGDTSTTYTILPEKRLDAAMTSRLAGTPLHDLTQLCSGQSTKGDERGSAIPVPAITVSLETAQRIAERLRALPSADAKEFFAAFGVARVRELLMVDEAMAEVFLAKKEGARMFTPDDDIAF